MKILIAGDFCPCDRVAALIDDDNYQSLLRDVKDVITEADYAIANFECVVTKGGEKPIEKCGPNLQCSEHGIEAIKWAGFDCVTLANNHFYDYGEQGVKNTLTSCDKYGMDVVGGGINLQNASRILYKRIGNETLAIINCCEHEFSIATETTGGSNFLNPIRQYYAIKEARAEADFVLVIVHGGHEHFQLPSPRMQETYRFFVDSGADAIVNHHQHCYSGYEVYQGKSIFYGLGNFCFDNPKYRNSNWNEGFMVMLDFSKKGCQFNLFPYYQCGKIARVKLLQNDSVKLFWEKLSTLNSLIQDKSALETEFQKYQNAMNNNIRMALSPYSGRISLALCNRHLLPDFLSEQKRRILLAYLQCESHYANVLYFLRKN